MFWEEQQSLRNEEKGLMAAREMKEEQEQYYP